MTVCGGLAFAGHEIEMRGVWPVPRLQLPWSMISYPAELKANRELSRKAFDGHLLTNEQIATIREFAKGLYLETSRRRWRHTFFGLMTLALIATLDGLLLTFATNSMVAWIGAWPTVLAIGLLHGFLSYGWVVYTIHEGAGHDGIVHVQSLKWISRQASRLVGADPEFYRQVHASHHLHLGTEDDRAFSHFVLPSRFYRSLLPFANIAPFNDYKIHAAPSLTMSGVLSMTIAIVVQIALLAFTMTSLSVPERLVALALIAPWFGFALDRLRETTEHQHMPADSRSGSRDFGLSLWGVVVGGGPWGQPCHLSHHLAPYLPWYDQLRVHALLKKTLSSRQRELFMTETTPASVRLLKRILRDNHNLLSEDSKRLVNHE